MGCALSSCTEDADPRDSANSRPAPVAHEANNTESQPAVVSGSGSPSPDWQDGRPKRKFNGAQLPLSRVSSTGPRTFLEQFCMTSLIGGSSVSGTRRVQNGTLHCALVDEFAVLVESVLSRQRGAAAESSAAGEAGLGEASPDTLYLRNGASPNHVHHWLVELRRRVVERRAQEFCRLSSSSRATEGGEMVGDTFVVAIDNVPSPVAQWFLRPLRALLPMWVAERQVEDHRLLLSAERSARSFSHQDVAVPRAAASGPAPTTSMVFENSHGCPPATLSDSPAVSQQHQGRGRRDEDEEAMFDNDDRASERNLHHKLQKWLVRTVRSKVSRLDKDSIQSLTSRGERTPRAATKRLGRAHRDKDSIPDIDALFGLHGTGYRCNEPTPEEQADRIACGIARARLSGVVSATDQLGGDTAGVLAVSSSSFTKSCREDPMCHPEVCLRYTGQKASSPRGVAQRRDSSPAAEGIGELHIDVPPLQFEEVEVCLDRSSTAELPPLGASNQHNPSTVSLEEHPDTSPARFSQNNNSSAQPATVGLHPREPAVLALVGLAAQADLIALHDAASAAAAASQKKGTERTDQPLIDPILCLAAYPLEHAREPRSLPETPHATDGTEARVGDAVFTWDIVAPLCSERKHPSIQSIVVTRPSDADGYRLGVEVLLRYSGFVSSHALNTIMASSHEEAGKEAKASRRALEQMAQWNDRNLFTWLISQYRDNTQPQLVD